MGVGKEITSVTVAEVWVDGDRLWTNSYANATRRQALAYAEASRAAQSYLERGIGVTLKARGFGPNGEDEAREVRAAAVIADV